MNARALTLLGLAVAAGIGAAAMWWQGREDVALQPFPVEGRAPSPATAEAAAARDGTARDAVGSRATAGAARVVQVRGRLGEAAIEAAQLDWDGSRIEVDRGTGTFAVAASAGGTHRLQGSWRDARGIHLVEREVRLIDAVREHDLGALAAADVAPAQLRVAPRIEGVPGLDAAALPELGRGRQLARVRLPHGAWNVQLGEAVAVHGVPAGGLQVSVDDAPPSMRVRRRLLRWTGPTNGRLGPGATLVLEVPYQADRSIALVARWGDERPTRVVVRAPDPGTGRPATLQLAAAFRNGAMVATGTLPFGPAAGPAVLFAEDAAGTRLAFAVLAVPGGAGAGPLHAELAPLVPATGAGAEPGSAVALALASWPELPLWSARADEHGAYAIPDAPADAALVQVRPGQAPLPLVTEPANGGLRLRPGP